MKSQLQIFSILFIGLVCTIGCQEDSHKAVTEDPEVQRFPNVALETEKGLNAYFGDLHVHTSWSFDAFIYNTRTTPDDAYVFGRGGAINDYIGEHIKLKRPLDFMAVTDHSEYMGVMKMMIDPSHELFNLDIAKEIRSNDATTSLEAFRKIGFSIANNVEIDELNSEPIRKDTWQRIIDIANKHYEPGKFTTFPAYEWTSSPGDSIGDVAYAKNLHRNVIYKGNMMSDLPFSSLNSQNPEKLWEWMDQERSKGIELMAIPHNGNMSDGLMYALSQYEGKPITKEYAETRMRNEPINEVVQIKGQSMTHPVLSPNDEFADFELFQYTFATVTPPPSRPQNSFVGQAYQNGLKFQKELGANPFQFGLIGSSDGHNSAGAVEEDNYFGKFGSRDGSAEMRMNSSGRFLNAKEMSAAGLAGVWAKENTRESIFAALQRKETFATSGTRIKMRLFAGYDLKSLNFDNSDWAEKAYDIAVPMGSDIGRKNNESPQFAIWAVKDPEGANLDRVQMIKAWVDESGKVHEKIFDVAWSGDRAVDSNGKLSPVGNTVVTKEASYTNTIGSVELKAVWQDPEFDPETYSMYYLRVLEIPTPRWSTFDAKKLGIELPDNFDAAIQERAWSSPIWYYPN